MKTAPRINYIKQMQAFIKVSRNLPPNAIVLYLRLFEAFNDADWPEEITLTSRELCYLANMANPQTLKSARDALLDRKLIGYDQFSKKSIGRYTFPALYSASKIDTKTEADFPESASKNVTKIDAKTEADFPESASKNVTKIVTKTEADFEFLPNDDIKNYKTIKRSVCSDNNTTHAHEEKNDDFFSLISSPQEKPPTLEEVQAFAETMHYTHTDPAAFWQHYEFSNWCDQGGRPINWRQKLFKWERDDAERKVLNGKGHTSRMAARMGEKERPLNTAEQRLLEQWGDD